MKTADNYSNPIMPVILDSNFSRAEKHEAINKAMESYARQHAIEFAFHIKRNVLLLATDLNDWQEKWGKLYDEWIESKEQTNE